MDFGPGPFSIWTHTQLAAPSVQSDRNCTEEIPSCGRPIVSREAPLKIPVIRCHSSQRGAGSKGEEIGVPRTSHPRMGEAKPPNSMRLLVFSPLKNWNECVSQSRALRFLRTMSPAKAAVRTPPIGWKVSSSSVQILKKRIGHGKRFQVILLSKRFQH